MYTLWSYTFKGETGLVDSDRKLVFFGVRNGDKDSVTKRIYLFYFFPKPNRRKIHKVIYRYKRFMHCHSFNARTRS